MVIKTKLLGSNGVEYIVEYFDANSFDSLPEDKLSQSYGVCFYEDKLVIGFGGMKKGWGLIGGSIEDWETARMLYAGRSKKNLIWKFCHFCR